MHSEVALAVAGEIRVKLTPREEARFGSARPVNTEAYDLYLRGKDLLNEFSEQAFKNSIQYFEQAIEIDPNYAPAHAGLAFSYRALSSNYLHPQEVMPKAKEAALRALQLDETLSEAHTSLGFIRLFYDWDWPGAERELQRAIELNPSSAEAHHWYRAFLTVMGRHE